MKNAYNGPGMETLDSIPGPLRNLRKFLMGSLCFS